MKQAQFHLWSSLGKKLLTGVTGVALSLFIIVHVAGNLTLFVGATAFNAYTHKLHSLGPLLLLVEVGLIAVIAVHAFAAINVWLDTRRARSVHNVVVRSKGPPSRQSVSSRTMIWTGAVLLVFTIIHLLNFRFGPAEGEGYVAALHGEPVRDLHRLVVETFHQLPYVVGYMAVMVLLGFHLRHGMWSAFQSVGALSPRLRAAAYTGGVVVSVIVAVGFFVMPLYIYWFVPGPTAAELTMVPAP